MVKLAAGISMWGEATVLTHPPHHICVKSIDMSYPKWDHLAVNETIAEIIRRVNDRVHKLPGLWHGGCWKQVSVESDSKDLRRCIWVMQLLVAIEWLITSRSYYPVMEAVKLVVVVCAKFTHGLIGVTVYLCWMKFIDIFWYRRSACVSQKKLQNCKISVTKPNIILLLCTLLCWNPTTRCYFITQVVNNHDTGIICGKSLMMHYKYQHNRVCNSSISTNPSVDVVLNPHISI